jgi:hypothetical protein
MLTRRSFVARAGAAAGALWLPGLARARAQDTKFIFKLRQHGDTCKACMSYDARKLFPTRKAANGNRSHIGCNCLIVRGSIDKRGWGLLFVPQYARILGPPTRFLYYVDRRDRVVRTVLKTYPPTFPA